MDLERVMESFRAPILFSLESLVEAEIYFFIDPLGLLVFERF